MTTLTDQIAAFNRFQYRNARITPGRKPTKELVNGILLAKGLTCRAVSHRNGTWDIRFRDSLGLGKSEAELAAEAFQALGVPVTVVTTHPSYAEWLPGKPLVAFMVTFKFVETKSATHQAAL